MPTNSVWMQGEDKARRGWHRLSVNAKDKFCGRCKTTKPVEQFHRCQSSSDGLYPWCKACKAEQRKHWRSENPDAQNARTKKYVDGLKNKVLSAYGHRCECCGEARREFLSIDHVGGGGLKHRMSLSRNGKSCTQGTFYLWIIKNGFPTSLRLLCFNCNCAIGFFGYCPHVQERVMLAGPVPVLDKEVSYAN